MTFKTALSLFGSIFLSAQIQAAELKVKIHSLRSTDGYVLVSVFKSADGFPDDAQKSVAKTKIKVKSKQVTARFKNLAPGKYAVAFIHDENGNDKLDTGGMGIPKEGFGFSRDPRITFGPPKFEECEIDVPKSGGDTSPRMKYY